MQKQKAGTKKERKGRSPEVIKEERTLDEASVVPRESVEPPQTEERQVALEPEKAG